MARARNIKPALFKNELLGEADPLLTILFQGLWCLADRDGRLEDRPKRIKAEIFPYRELPLFNGYLTELQRLGFIDRYVVGDIPIIQVINFAKHQNPHKTEKRSELPENTGESISCEITEVAPLNNGSLTVVARLIPDSFNLIPDSLIPDSLNTPNGVAVVGVVSIGFDEFYEAYPKKVGRDDALRAWKKLKPDQDLITHIMWDIDQRVRLGAWCTGKGKAFIPGPAPYLNQKKWRDEIIPRPEFKPQQDFSAIARDAVII